MHRVRVDDYLNNKEMVAKRDKMFGRTGHEYKCVPVNLNGAITPVDSSVTFEDIKQDIARRFY